MGKHIGMHREMKISLFSKVRKIINRHKRYSLCVLVPQLDFRAMLPDEACRELIGPYALAFLSAVMFNQVVATKRRLGQTSMSYLVDDGCSGKDQLVAAHSLLLGREIASGGHRYTGTIEFDTDDRVSALQAADVISWSARRRNLGQLTNEFDPLKDLFVGDLSSSQRESHATITVPRDGIEMWARPIRNWLSATGKVPQLKDFVL